MIDFIEFLFKNIGIIVVVGGFILTFLAKRSQSAKPKSGDLQTGKRKTNPMMPPFGGGTSGERNRWPQMSSPRDESDAGRVVRGGAVAEKTNEDSELRNGVDPSAHYRESLNGSESVQRSRIGATDIEGEPIGSGSKVHIQNDAVRGMVWAEIMGPPRSKKPYRPKNR